MNDRITYGVLGAGMQGPAIAYDLARFGKASKVVLGDIDPVRVRAQSKRVNLLVGRAIVEPVIVDVRNPNQLEQFFKQCDLVVSALPTEYNPMLALFALEARKHFCDLGTNSEWFWNTFRLESSKAETANISIVPNCGLAPGMVNHLALYMMETLPHCEEIHLYCGGLPQNPQPPLYYEATFNVGGLLEEYSGTSVVLRDGSIISVPALSETEVVDLGPIGRLEAALTSGSLGTAPYTFQGKLKTLDYKTLRYLGHWDRIRFLRDAGFFSKEPVLVGAGYAVTPREVTEHVIRKVILKPRASDLVVIHVRASARAEGKFETRTATILDRADEITNFSAMERVTGFSASIIAIAIAEGKVPRGIVPYEQSMSGHGFLEAFLSRGFRIQESSA
ncbi:MAG: saccharopine dehydrogenase family protein [bacterium JZ-2024 1]